ncbi:MAG: hypothetical protein HZA70_04565 [Planctomycetes bacterium]|nr:hypothetical protein [Planctomycetota bacterium]
MHREISNDIAKEVNGTYERVNSLLEAWARAFTDLKEMFNTSAQLLNIDLQESTANTSREVEKASKGIQGLQQTANKVSRFVIGLMVFQVFLMGIQVYLMWYPVAPPITKSVVLGVLSVTTFVVLLQTFFAKD